MFGKVTINDPYNTMGTPPARPGRVRPFIPAALADGNLEGVPVADIARRHGLTLEAAALFRDSWNEACRYEGKPRGQRAAIDLDDITADSKNWKHW